LHHQLKQVNKLNVSFITLSAKIDAGFVLFFAAGMEEREQGVAQVPDVHV